MGRKENGRTEEQEQSGGSGRREQRVKQTRHKPTDVLQMGELMRQANRELQLR